MKIGLEHVTPIQHVINGRRALREVQGLKAAVARGIVINLVIYALLMAGLCTGLYLWVHQPIEQWLINSVEAWYGPVLRVALWMGLGGIVLILLLISLRVSLKFMGLWHEQLVVRVVEHHRGSENGRFSLKGLVADLARSVADISREIVLVIGVFLLGFIPLIGPILVLIGTAWLLGRGLLDPYRCVCLARKEKLEIEGNPKLVLILLGLPELLLAVIPVIGWIILPIVVTLQVIGLSWTLEVARQKSIATTKPDPIM